MIVAPLIAACLIIGPEPHGRLLDAICWVESRGDVEAVGDGGRSLGAYQITKPYWTDASQQLGVGWDYHAYVRSEWHCRRVIRAYWRRYGANTDEDRARCHNAGNRWRTRARKASLRYWTKVQRRLRR